MGTGPAQKSRRLRFRFSPTGDDADSPAARERSEIVSSDEILDSLKKQGQDDPQENLEIDDTDMMEEEVSQVGKGHRKAGFAMLIMSALAAVWVYESITRPSSTLSLLRLAEYLNLSMIFANLLQISIIALTGITVISLLTHRRRRQVSVMD